MITGNSAGCGGGISWLVPSGARGPLLVNNTIAHNYGAQGSDILANGFDAQTKLINNIIIATSGQTAVFCGSSNDPNAPIFEFNNVFSSEGIAYGGLCTDQTGISGNISAIHYSSTWRMTTFISSPPPPPLMRVITPPQNYPLLTKMAILVL